jgi:hypothetical protein
MLDGFEDGTPVYTPRHVIALYLDLKESLPAPAAWVVEGCSGPLEPNGRRLRRLQGLQRAFGLGERPDDIPSGAFIAGRDLNRYTILLERATDGQTGLWAEWILRDFRLYTIQHLYCELFSYVQAVESLVSRLRHRPPAHGLELFGERLMARTSAGLVDQLSDLKDVVALIMCPEGKTIADDELGQYLAEAEQASEPAAQAGLERTGESGK